MKCFTNPDQSRRLLELGVEKNSADCYYDMYKMLDDTIIHVMTANEKDIASKTDAFWHVRYPCWSVGQLIEVLREITNHEFGDFHTHLTNIIVSDDVVETLMRGIQWELPRYKRYQERKKEESKASAAPQKKSGVSRDVEVLSLASKAFGEMSVNDDDYVGMQDFLY